MLGNLSVALMILNSTNQYLLKIQVTVIPNFKNKEQLSGSMLVRGNQWRQLWHQQLFDGVGQRP